MRIAPLALLSLLACSKHAAPTPTVEASAPVTTVAPAVDAAPPAPEVPTYRASVAKFTGDALTECVDFVITVTADAGAVKGNPAERAIKDLQKKDKSLTSIPKSCDEQFRDHVVLASCTLNADEARGSLTATSSRYSFAEVGLSDAAMKECLDGKGEWTALPRDSKEWRQAKLDHSRKRLEKITGKLADEP